jgi:ABC-2 type transport system permease protein
MIRLVRSELLRIRSRRLVWILAVLALLGIVVGVGIGTIKSHKPTLNDVARADRSFTRDMRSCLNGDLVDEQRLPAGETFETWCPQVVLRGDHPASAFASSNGTVLQLSGLQDVLKGTSFLLIVIGIVIGASSVGADWQSGSMATLLTWEPRRMRVLLVRVLVVALAVLVLALSLQVVLSLAMAVGAALRGDTTLPPGYITDVIEVILRVGAVAALASVIGIAISSIGRSTAASLGVIFVYLALVESLLRGLAPRLAPWLLSVNLVAVVDGRAQDLGDGRIVSVTQGAVTVGAYAVGLVVLALVFFRARDVN